MMRSQGPRQKQAKLSMEKLIKLDRQLSNQRNSGDTRMQVPRAVVLSSRVSCRCRICNSVDTTNLVYVFDSGLVYCCETCGGRNSFSAQKAGQRQKYIKILIAVVAVLVAAELIYVTGIGRKVVNAWKDLFENISSHSEGQSENGGDDDSRDSGEIFMDGIEIEDDPTTTTTTTRPTTTTTTTTQPPTTREEYPTDNYGRIIPESLRQYASGLRAENRTYQVQLQEDDWNINYRSSPVLPKPGSSQNNKLGVIPSGTLLSVEYIYDGTWAVFQWDGRYVFASIYSSNDPSQRRLMNPY